MPPLTLSAPLPPSGSGRWRRRASMRSTGPCSQSGWRPHWRRRAPLRRTPPSRSHVLDPSRGMLPGAARDDADCSPTRPSCSRPTGQDSPASRALLPDGAGVVQKSCSRDSASTLSRWTQGTLRSTPTSPGSACEEESRARSLAPVGAAHWPSLKPPVPTRMRDYQAWRAT
jgi:hypothetical protein